MKNLLVLPYKPRVMFISIPCSLLGHFLDNSLEVRFKTSYLAAQWETKYKILINKILHKLGPCNTGML